MAVAYYISVTLALFAGTLPAQVLGVIWEPIGASIPVEIPYIALLRLLGGAGAVVAVILSDRIRGYILARDFIVGAIALEAVSLIGFSLSREFWNLAVWITALGFSGGLCLTLICYLLRETWSKKTGMLFVSSACGAAAGVYLVSRILSMGRSWRTACQTLAIVQIVLCLSVFFLRRTLLRDVAVILKKQKKEMEMLRFRRREKLIRENGEVDERYEDAWLIRLLFLYGSAVCCGLLLLSAIHLTYSVQVTQSDPSADLTLAVLMVCGGMAAGRVLIFILKRNVRSVCVIGAACSLGSLAVSAILARMGQDGAVVWFIVRFGTGFGAGMIFPYLIQLDDERVDHEAQICMTGLIPAFYLGADAMITPFVQSMSQSFHMGGCIFVLFILTCCMSVCLAFALVRVKKR